jgi:hypothetical protein
VKNYATCFYWFDSIQILTLALTWTPVVQGRSPQFSCSQHDILNSWQWFNFSQSGVNFQSNSQVCKMGPSLSPSLTPFLKWVPPFLVPLSLPFFVSFHSELWQKLPMDFFSNKSRWHTCTHSPPFVGSPDHQKFLVTIE